MIPIYNIIIIIRIHICGIKCATSLQCEYRCNAFGMAPTGEFISAAGNSLHRLLQRTAPFPGEMAVVVYAIG